MFNLHLTDEQKAIRDSVRNFVRKEIKPIANERDRLEDFDERFPWEALDKASELGLRTLLLSTENGGAGVDALTYCIVIEELAAGDVGIAATLGQTAAPAVSDSLLAASVCVFAVSGSGSSTLRPMSTSLAITRRWICDVPS